MTIQANPSEILRFSCHRAAVISDIHSNYYAFRACYEDAVRQGADCFIFLGDYVSDLSETVKTMDLLRHICGRYPAVCLSGNRERYLLEDRGRNRFCRGSASGSLLYTLEQLRPRDMDFLEKLPSYRVIELNGVLFEVAHAVEGDDRFLFDGSDPRIGEVFARMKHRWLLTGHAHRQYLKVSGEKRILNPGSVGVPRGYGPKTQYALLEFCGEDIRCRLLQLSYDVRATVRAQFESGLADYAPCWAAAILYDVITGEEHAIRLLAQVPPSARADEAVWRSCATKLGMKFTEGEILSFLEQTEK